MTFVRGSERLHGNPRARQRVALHSDIGYLARTIPETHLRGWIEYFLSAKGCYDKSVFRPRTKIQFEFILQEVLEDDKLDIMRGSVRYQHVFRVLQR